jgi:hypothetical protein
LVRSGFLDAPPRPISDEQPRPRAGLFSFLEAGGPDQVAEEHDEPDAAYDDFDVDGVEASGSGFYGSGLVVFPPTSVLSRR